jgi:hypothetical protein
MTLRERAIKLQRLLYGDGIEASIEECEHLLICDFIDQIRKNSFEKVLDTVSP